MHRSASPRPGAGYTTGRSGSIAQGSPRLGHKVLQKVQGDESPALSFLARRGSEAQNNNSDDSDDSFEREVAMANAGMIKLWQLKSSSNLLSFDIIFLIST